MTSLSTLAVLAPLAFGVGFALQRGNICSVLAAREVAQTGKCVRLHGLLLTSGWGIAILLPLVWLNIGPFELSQQVMPGPLTVLAGVVYAFGCYLTGACIFGICSRTTAGHTSFAFAIPSMAIGATLGQISGWAPVRADKSPTIAHEPNILLVILWGLVLLWLGRSAVNTIRAHRRAGISIGNLLQQSRWRSAFAAIVIGSIGALLFATNTAWFYPAAAKRIALYISGLSTTFPIDSVVGGLSIFAGGIAAALYKGRVVYRRPHLLPTFQAIVGGGIIGFAWALIPGGNDSMVLYLLPSLALNGIVAYASMFAALVAIEHLKRRGNL